MAREFLVSYDYGSGGVWAIICAESPEQITARYPKLTIMESRPRWMSDREFEDIRKRLSFSIDDPPSGFLAELAKP